MTSEDYTGVATIIGASTVGLGTLITSGLAVLTFMRQGARDRKIEEVHRLVNGMSHELQAADKAAARAEGVVEGVTQERASPMVPAPPSGPLDVTVVNPPTAPIPVETRPKGKGS